MKNTSRLRELFAGPSILIVPGAAEAINARLIEEAGFAAVYATGAGIANSLLALPDIGLLSFSEMIESIRRIVQAVNIPVIADADEGYGNPLNVRRTVQEYEHAGVAAAVRDHEQVVLDLFDLEGLRRSLLLSGRDAGGPDDDQCCENCDAFHGPEL